MRFLIDKNDEVIYTCVNLCIYTCVCIYLLFHCMHIIHPSSTSSVPSAPRNVILNCTGPTSVNITWSAPAYSNGILLHYNVFLEDDVRRSGLLVDIVMADPSIISYSYSLTNLVPNVIYVIEVSAETRIGEGARISRLLLMDHGVGFVSPPSFVSAKTLNSTAILLMWSYPQALLPDINGSIIYHNVTSEGQTSVDISVMNNMRNHVFQGLMPFTYYEFSASSFSLFEKVETTCSKLSSPAVARTDEDCKILRICGMYSYMFRSFLYRSDHSTGAHY